ncbi:hypothetical protein BC834DRAFT_878274 [Gloeopeniophorella convolvens]|nr:hypothetical protein BC834DRAFT_878274 [Gloeopeniophorella convolvens]
MGSRDYSACAGRYFWTFVPCSFLQIITAQSRCKGCMLRRTLLLPGNYSRPPLLESRESLGTKVHCQHQQAALATVPVPISLTV